MGGKSPRPPPAHDSQGLAQRSVEALFANDAASGALGIAIEEVGPGFARLRMAVRPDMLNGHGTCHGGFIFALADSAFAAACNTYDAVTVAAAAAIDFLAPAQPDDVLTARARELWRSKRSGIYEVAVTNQRGETVALFRGRSHCKGGPLIPGAAAASGAGQGRE